MLLKNYDNVILLVFLKILTYRSLTNIWVQAHFEEALTARHRGSDSKKLVIKGVRGKGVNEKLSEEALVTLSSRVKMQVTFLTVLIVIRLMNYYFINHSTFTLWFVIPID